LREQPLPLDDQRSLEVYKGVRRGLLKESLTRRQYAAVLADAAHFLQSPRTGDGVSAAMLLSALTQSLLPARLHLSSPEERRLAGEAAALLVPACERALAELLGAAQEARLAIDRHGDAYTLGRAEFCLASAYEFAAFVEPDPAEKERLLAKAFIVYNLATENYPGVFQIMAGRAGSLVAATDEERLQLARRLSAAIRAALQAVTPAQRAASGEPYLKPYLYGESDPLFPFTVQSFLYDDAQPRPHHPLYLLDGYPLDGRTFLRQTWLNRIILALWEDCESAEAGRAAVDILIGLYAARGQAGDAEKGAVAILMLQLYTRSGDEYWLSAAPGYLRGGGDPLTSGEWEKLAERARFRRAQLVAQLDDPDLCRDPDGLVIRLRNGDLITDQQGCEAAREFIASYPMVAETRPSLLGATYGTERFIWEHVSKR
jgi:hypothetical protein